MNSLSTIHFYHARFIWIILCCHLQYSWRFYFLHIEHASLRRRLEDAILMIATSQWIKADNRIHSTNAWWVHTSHMHAVQLTFLTLKLRKYLTPLASSILSLPSVVLVRQPFTCQSTIYSYFCYHFSGHRCLSRLCASRPSDVVGPRRHAILQYWSPNKKRKKKRKLVQENLMERDEITEQRLSNNGLKPGQIYFYRLI